MMSRRNISESIKIVLSWFLFPETFRKKYISKKEDTKYYSDASGERVENIPYNDYIEYLPLPENAVEVKGLSENNPAEENGKIIQNTIDALSSGGTVLIPKGRFLTNTIILKDNITLFVQKGAELVSIACKDNEKSRNPLHFGVIYAEGAENITVTGGGIINGSGLTYVAVPKASYPFYALNKFNTYIRVNEARKHIRMGRTSIEAEDSLSHNERETKEKQAKRNNILNFSNCSNVSVNNIILKNTASWTCVFSNCHKAKAENIVIDNNMHIANSDGIDICGGSDYSISHCFIVTGDDGIVLKSPDYPIENVQIKNCEISSCANCFKIGTETQHDVSNVNIDSCFFFMPDNMTYGYSGLAVESCDGANVRNINMTNITMSGISAPLLIWLGNRLRYSRKTVGSINEVSAENINAVNIEMPSAIVGCKDDEKTYYLKNIKIKNFTSRYRDTGEALIIRKRVNESAMDGYPEITRVSHRYFKSHILSRYSDLPCYSACIKHAENTEFMNICTTPRKENTRNEFYIEDVNQS